MVQKKTKGKRNKVNNKVNMEDIVVEEQNIDEELEEFIEGTDPAELYSNNEEKSIEVFHAGKKWVFKYKDLNWGDKNFCIDAAQTWDGEKGFQFSISRYYAAALTKMLTVTPIHPITETTLSKLDRRIGEQLTAIVPQPVEANQVENVKKA